MRTAVSGIAGAQSLGRNKKDPNKILLQSDTSSSDSLTQSQPPSRVDSDDGATGGGAGPGGYTQLSVDGLNMAGGPTTRRAWNDLCKSGNNSNHESNSEDDEGS